MLKNKLIYFVILLLSVLVFSGCNQPAGALAKFNSFYAAEAQKPSDFINSEQFAQSKLGKNNSTPKGEDLLWTLQLGSIERTKQDYAKSNEYFDKSEEMLGYFDYQNQLTDSAASIAVNENVIPYTGKEYDGIMVNTYKALNFMALGEYDFARIEFNRILERQRRALEKYRNEVARLQQELDTEKAKKDSQTNRNVNNPQVQQIIAQRYSDLSAYQAYPDFVNPFSTYLGGVFFALIGDYTKSASMLKEAYGMVEDNDYIAEDLAAIEQILDGQKELNDTVWVFFENGVGPIREEFRIDIPLYIATDQVRYVGIALPKLSFRQQAYPQLSILAGRKQYRTQQVASMDRIIQTEFEKEFKNYLTRAIISTSAKAVAQYALEKQKSSAGSLASVLMAVYSYATTAADVRIWSTLPKDFQVARLSIPGNRNINIASQSGPILDIQIPACNNAVVYVKIPYKNAIPVYDIIKY